MAATTPIVVPAVRAVAAEGSTPGKPFLFDGVLRGRDSTSTPSVYFGTGPPSATYPVAMPLAGWYYFRRDTPAVAQQQIYVCTVGGATPTWVSVVPAPVTQRPPVAFAGAGNTLIQTGGFPYNYAVTITNAGSTLMVWFRQTAIKLNAAGLIKVGLQMDSLAIQTTQLYSETFGPNNHRELSGMNFYTGLSVGAHVLHVTSQDANTGSDANDSGQAMWAEFPA